MNHQEIINKIISRRSYKKFDTTKKIPDETWSLILESARFSPSSFGLEPWKIIEINSQTSKEKLKEIMPGAHNPDINYYQLETADKFLILLARTWQNGWFGSEYLNNHLVHTKKLPPERLAQRIQYMQDWLASIEPELSTSHTSFLAYASNQVYILLNQILLSANLLGVDSCSIGGFNHSLLNQFLIDNNVYKQGDFEPVVAVALGYRDGESAYVNTRNELADIYQVV